MTDQNSDVLAALAKLELTVVQKLTDQALAFRDRLENVERRNALELKEALMKVWERIEQLSNKLHDKTDGQRAANSHHAMWWMVGLIANIAVAAIAILYRKVG